MTSLPKILIKDGLLYDPAQEWRGEKGDIYIADGKFTESFSDPEITIDAKERPLMAGGIESFCHVAIPGQQILRMDNDLPSIEEIGTAYAKSGYVHIHQPIMTLLTANAVWRYLKQIPYLDKSAWVTIDYRDIGKYVKSNNYDEFIAQTKVLMKLSGAIGLFLPFPYLKHKQRHYMQKNISAKKTFEFVSAIDDSNILPIHFWAQPGMFDAKISNPENIHISNLGMAIHSDEDIDKFKEFMNAGGSANICLNDGDEGLVVLPDKGSVPGSISLDLGLNYSLRISKEQIDSHNAWALLKDIQPEWRISISSAKLGGGTVNHMPVFASWLLNKNSRAADISNILSDYSIDLYEYAKMTRTEPARSLGLDNTGNLKNGSRATIAIYNLNIESSPDEYQKALSDCCVLIKDGIILRNNDEFTGDISPAIPIATNVDVDPKAFEKSDLLQRPTLRWENLDVEL